MRVRRESSRECVCVGTDERKMNRHRWLIAAGVAILPMLCGWAMLPAPAESPRPADVNPHAKVTNPHGQLAIPCQNCHTYTSWKPIRSTPEFNHDHTGYPLRGMHQNVPCVKCHTSLVFKHAGKQCADCHADIHQRQFGANCQSCHSVKGWQVSLQAIRNHQNRFPLVGAHALIDCEECHKGAAVGQFKGLSTACYSCHQKDFQTPVIDHVSSGFPTTCDTCHTMDTWFGAKFDHLKVTGYALTGMHATLECTACHINNRFKGTPADCNSCHGPQYQKSSNPSHVALALPRDCASCHTTLNWSTTKFDHALYAHYPLTGRHTNLACAQCHLNNDYRSTSTACYSCHKPQFDSTKSPSHLSEGFPFDCSICHTTAGWSPSSFDHNKVFALTGAHQKAKCSQCHTDNNYKSIPKDCYSCHRTNFDSTKSPNHLSLGFPTGCAVCHNTTAWIPSTFDHSKSGFALTGAHQKVKCSQCHVNNNYTTVPKDCYSCHKAAYSSTTSPSHVALGFPTGCEVCHTTSAWKPSSFDHSRSGFPLTGAHKKVKCELCHVNNNYTTLPKDCYSCHKQNFNSTASPPHLSQGFPFDCTMCHTTDAWTPSTFDHSKVFALTGAHKNLQCAQCHINNNYKTVPKDCYSCHSSNFVATNNPSHLQLGLPHNCGVCHSTTNWQNATFDHAVYAHYQLTGMHKTVPCAKCHVNNNYSNTLTACASCHLADFNKTTNPNHKVDGFPTDCSFCHSTSGWIPSTFDHSTVFPLTGAHKSLLCAQCHINNNYKTVPKDCYSCHQSQFKATNNPSHVSAGFPTDCSMCHTTNSWAGAIFDHTKTPFPLTGAHTGVPCLQCHVNNVFAGTPTDCYSCHKAQYTSTTDPNHTAAGFPTTCALCHTTSSWLGATFNHTWFDTHHGGANGVCSTCHTNPSNYAVFTCTNCHTKSRTDSDHQGVQGYVYNSVNCYACHKNGGGG